MRKKTYAKFRNAHEAILAYDYKQISLQEKIQVRLPRYPKVVNDEKGPVEEMPENGRIITTVGRIPILRNPCARHAVL